MEAFLVAINHFIQFTLDIYELTTIPFARNYILK